MELSQKKINIMFLRLLLLFIQTF